MVPLSRGASFGADAECMSYFKAERTMASLNLFPRSEITKKKKKEFQRLYLQIITFKERRRFVVF